MIVLCGSQQRFLPFPNGITHLHDAISILPDAIRAVHDEFLVRPDNRRGFYDDFQSLYGLLNKTKKIKCAGYLDYWPTARCQFEKGINAKNPILKMNIGFSCKKGGDLLSHFYAVPSALTGLTSLFGMGRGGALSL